MPSRTVVSRSPKRNVGLINCHWFQDEPIEHESRLEKHFVLRAMLFPGLISIQHQPFRMSLVEHGKSYTPDFLLTFSNGEYLVVEVKRSERIKEKKERFDEIAMLCSQASLRFFVVHQGQIEGGLRAERAAVIRRYAMHAPAPETVRMVVDYVCQCKTGIPMTHLSKRLQITQESILAMVARRQIAINKELIIADDGLVFPINSEIKNASVQFGGWFGCASWRTTVGVSKSVGWEQDPVSGSKDAICSGYEAVHLLRGGDV